MAEKGLAVLVRRTLSPGQLQRQLLPPLKQREGGGQRETNLEPEDFSLFRLGETWGR